MDTLDERISALAEDLADEGVESLHITWTPDGARWNIQRNNAWTKPVEEESES